MALFLTSAPGHQINVLFPNHECSLGKRWRKPFRGLHCAFTFCLGVQLCLGLQMKIIILHPFQTVALILTVGPKAPLQDCLPLNKRWCLVGGPRSHWFLGEAIHTPNDLHLEDKIYCGTMWWDWGSPRHMKLAPVSKMPCCQITVAAIASEGYNSRVIHVIMHTQEDWGAKNMKNTVHAPTGVTMLRLKWPI